MKSVFNYIIKSHIVKRQLEIYSNSTLQNKIKKIQRNLEWKRVFNIKSNTLKIDNLTFSAFNFDTLCFLFYEIFVKGSYYFHVENKKPIIIDAGANIGMATLFFKYLYPDAEIYAFEPSPIIFKQLSKNIDDNNFKDVHLMNVALFNKTSKIVFSVGDADSGTLIGSISAKRNNYASELLVDAIKLSDFIIDNNIEIIDFLKIDIEGSEGAVFSDLYENNLLKRINAMSIEFHNQIPDFENSFADFIKIIDDSGFSYSIDSQSNINKVGEMQDIQIFCVKKSMSDL